MPSQDFCNARSLKAIPSRNLHASVPEFCSRSSHKTRSRILQDSRLRAPLKNTACTPKWPSSPSLGTPQNPFTRFGAPLESHERLQPSISAQRLSKSAARPAMIATTGSLPSSRQERRLDHTTLSQPSRDVQQPAGSRIPPVLLLAPKNTAGIQRDPFLLQEEVISNDLDPCNNALIPNCHPLDYAAENSQNFCSSIRNQRETGVRMAPQSNPPNTKDWVFNLAAEARRSDHLARTPNPALRIRESSRTAPRSTVRFSPSHAKDFGL